MDKEEDANPVAEKIDKPLDGSAVPADAVAEKELSSITAEEESQPSEDPNLLAENESDSTTTEDDLDPISAFMKLATEEVSTSKSKEIAERIVSSIATKEKQASPSTDVDENLVDQNELTENEFAMIIEEATLAKDLRTDEVSVLPSTKATSKPSVAKPPSPPKTLDNLITDSSSLLLDYELRIQGKYMCDVIEIPEHILVITIPKAKELRLSNSYNWPNNEEKQVPRSLLDIPPDISISRTLSEETRRPIRRKPFQTEQIDYVYYMGEDETPRRDREVQVDVETTTKDIGNQCDAEFDLSLHSLESRLRTNCPADLNKRECLVCGEILLNYIAQIKHFSLHDNTVPSLCSFCGVMYSSAEKLLIHEKYFHGKFMMDINEAMRCPRPYCSKAFYSKKLLNDHIEEHIGNISYKCYICLRKFNSSLQLFRHQRTSKFCLSRKRVKQNMFFRRMLEC